MATTDDKTTYCACMDEVNRRLGILVALTRGTVSLGDDSADGEVACIQLRKVLELIAFASLSVNREQYAAAQPKYMHEWRAKQILKNIETVHPDFYPAPVVPQKVGQNRWHFERPTGGFLTREDFVFLYDRSCDGLHESNPFSGRPRIVDFERPIAQWVARIEGLLSHHLIRRLDQREVLLVQLNGDDGKAHVLTAAPQGA